MWQLPYPHCHHAAGLHFIWLFKIDLLHREARYHHHSQPVGFLGPGIGWPLLAGRLASGPSSQPS
jgi:hypothetical protein